MNTYLYRAFGLTFSTPFPMDCLMPGHGEPDVKILIRHAPERIENPILDTGTILCSPEEVLFVIKDVAKLHILNGNEIRIDPAVKIRERTLHAYLLGAGFGALLFQRGFLPLHGSVLKVRDRAVIVLGRSGSGKSTLTRALMNQGVRLLSDDLAAVDIPPGSFPTVFPGYPQQKLWADTIREMQVNPDGQTLPRVKSDQPKYAVACLESFYNRPLRLGRIYEISVRNGPEVGLETVSGARKAALIMGHAYGRYLAGGLDISELFFEKSICLAHTIGLTRILRPEDRFSALEIAQRVLEDARNGPL